MNGKERVKTTLDHKEPDRVPLIEVAVGNRLGSSVVGRDVNIFFSGDAIRNLIKANTKEDHRDKEEFALEGFRAQLEVFSRLGIDAVPAMPGAFVLNTIDPFGHSGMNDNPAREVEIIGREDFHIKDEYGFWSKVRYNKDSDTANIYDHSLCHDGIKGLKRLVKIWSEKDYSRLPEEWQVSVNAIRSLKEMDAYKDHYIMGYADILPPFLEPWTPLFLEWVITEPNTVFEYMELQAQGWYSVLEHEISTGVIDGVFGSMDWCYKSGCLVSPKHFRQLFAPGLKKIVDLAHDNGLKYIKHCDGNVRDILDIMLDHCGIDALHPIEPTGGMDMADLKKRYGDRLTLCGNVDCGKMVNWTEEEIESEVKKVIGTAAKGGGFILSSSNSLHSGIPVENAYAYAEAARKWGKYPIDIR